ncbi:small ubiquitin-related modifier 1-like [Capsella rubella]|uniref:small ubiquitin-related modifier 1-like n=1 Tax=Capsella rubella TaxID=81985 RepID=UPI000CD51217|nr:small ubiquitin-related modifier 1-like [Capsella rubella]
MSTVRSDITDDGNSSVNSSINNGGEVIDQKEKRIVLKTRYHYRDDTVRYFKMNRNKQFEKLMKCYCALQSLDFDNTVFFSYGRRLSPEQTPNELDMKNGDEIEALID